MSISPEWNSQVLRLSQGPVLPSFRGDAGVQRDFVDRLQVNTQGLGMHDSFFRGEVMWGQTYQVNDEFALDGWVSCSLRFGLLGGPVARTEKVRTRRAK